MNQAEPLIDPRRLLPSPASWSDMSNSRPRVQLSLYDSAIVLTRYEGLRTTSYPVALHDVAQTFGGVGLRSGLLPHGTVFYNYESGQAALGLYLPAQVHQVLLQDETLDLPWPPLLFIGQGRRYHVFAVKELDSVSSPTTPLFHAPCPNVYPDGSICQGNAPFPTCSPATIRDAFHCFMDESHFNRDLAQNKCRRSPENVLRLWHELAGEANFPLTELVRSTRHLQEWIAS